MTQTSQFRRLLRPLVSVLDRAARILAPADVVADASGAPGKPGLLVSPLAVPFPAIAAVNGVEIAIGRAGYYKHQRDDVLVMRFAQGTTCAGVFTRHAVGSAPVDWCKRQLEASGG